MVGKLDEAMSLSKDILGKIASHQVGYESTSGRYASYILGYYQLYVFKNLAEAKTYFNQCLTFSKETDSMDSGYYWASVLGLARIAFQEAKYDEAVDYCKEVMDKADRKSAQHTEAKNCYLRPKKQGENENKIFNNYLIYLFSLWRKLYPSLNDFLHSISTKPNVWTRTHPIFPLIFLPFCSLCF